MRHVAGGAGVARQPALPADVRTRLPVRHHAGAPRHPDRQRVLLSGPPVPPCAGKSRRPRRAGTAAAARQGRLPHAVPRHPLAVCPAAARR
ncbi:hypothetical protein G6F58_013341 [Rhizopus delemar]|nr:hypothetical protein G6F58_013341 [Rhizopus delemar]